MSNKPIKAWYSNGGSLMPSGPIEDITQELREGSSQSWYGGRWFVCETIMPAAAKALAEAMGWEWLGRVNDNNTEDTEGTE